MIDADRIVNHFLPSFATLNIYFIWEVQKSWSNHVDVYNRSVIERDMRDVYKNVEKEKYAFVM